MPDLKRWAWPGIAALVIFSQAWETGSVFPYYHSYYNSIIGGGSKAQEVMMIGWGEGLDQAARYLSEKPKANKQIIYSWYAATFEINYVYWTRFDLLPEDLPISGPINDEDFSKMLQADYVVTYISQWQRNSSQRLLEFLSDKPVEHVIKINDIDYVYIYNMKAIKTDD